MSSYGVKAVGSVDGDRFDGWATVGQKPKTFEVLSSENPPKPLSIDSAQALKKGVASWLKSLKGATLVLQVVPIPSSEPASRPQQRQVTPTGRYIKMY